MDLLLPTASGLVGIFSPEGALMRAVVVIDYQNVHLTAWEVFNRAG